jgi:transposase
LQTKRHFVADKIIIGIDPAKRKHQAVVLNPTGLQMGTDFSFKNSHDGFHVELWKKLPALGVAPNPEKIIFAIELSCNLWQNLANYLHAQGYKVVLVSPFTTKRSRPFINHDFSKTDPKDAILVASNAKSGYFDYFISYSEHIKAMHQLSLTYDKLRKNLVQNKQRLRAQIEQVFPEFLTVIDSDIDTARYLLQNYFLPRHYLELDIEHVAKEMEATSRQYHGKETLLKIRQLAETSVGIPVADEFELSVKLTIQGWIIMIETIQKQMKQIMNHMILLAKQSPYFAILISLKGISDKLAAFFIAETRDLSLYDHYKKLEKFASLNLRQTQSGQYVGKRHISRMGNHRLCWAVYKMTEETARYVPEVRAKYLRRQMKQAIHSKSVVAASTTLLKIIVALVKSNRLYETNPDNSKALEILESKYKEKKIKKEILQTHQLSLLTISPLRNQTFHLW